MAVDIPTATHATPPLAVGLASFKRRLAAAGWVVLRLRRGALGLTLTTVLMACAGDPSASDLMGTWQEAGTERLLTLADDSAFRTSDGAVGTWSTDDDHLVLDVEAGVFRQRDLEADAGYRTSGPYELDADSLRYLEVTYERASPLPTELP
jgi:hypothetical protein